MKGPSYNFGQIVVWKFVFMVATCSWGDIAKVPYICKIWQIARKIMACIQPSPPPPPITFNRVWLKLDENWEQLPSCHRKFCKVQRMTPNWTKQIRHEKYLYICTSWDRKAQIFIRFTLQSALFKILHILGFSHWLPLKIHIQSATTFLKAGTRITQKKCNTCILYSTIVSNVLIMLDEIWWKLKK